MSHQVELDRALRAVILQFAAETGTLHVLEEGRLVLRAIVGDFPPPVMDAIRAIPVGKGMAGLAAERREPVTVCNLQTDVSGDVRPGAKATGMEGAIALPLIASDGRLVGTLGIANRNARTWTEEESALLLAEGRRIADGLGAARRA
jgi:putative methionine-R-sulfoxide reductase with GAF domain